MMLNSAIQYREYQKSAVESVWSEWLRGVRSTLVVAATGVGKSVIVCGVAERMPSSSRFLYTVHREELAYQAAEKFERFTGRSVQLEMKEFGKNLSHDGDASIIVASVHAMRGRKVVYDPCEFDYVGTDESHRFIDNTWADTVNYFKPRNRIGLTATPDRHDGKEMGLEFDSEAFRYPIETAIDDGWIVPFVWQIERCRDLDIDSVGSNGLDLRQGELSRVMTADPVVRHVVAKTIMAANGRQGMVFCVDVDQATAVHREFHRRGVSSMLVTAETTPELRKELNQQYKAGRIQMAVNCDVFIEGYDAPGIAVVANAAMTLSWSRHVQRCGRGSRTVGEPVGETPAERRAWIATSSKPECLLLDFVGVSKRHRLQMGMDVLGGVFTDQEREEAVRLVADTSGRFDINEITSQARSNVAARPKSTGNGEFKFNDLAAEKRFSFQNFAHPFDVLGLDGRSAEREVTDDEAYNSFEAARLFLEESKLTEKEIQSLNQREIVYLKMELLRRGDVGLCSFPQARRLFNLGYDVATMTALDAKRKIVAVRGAGWVRPVQDGPNVRFQASVR